MLASRIIVKIIYFLEALFIRKEKHCPYCGSRDNQVVLRKAFVVNVCYCRACFLYWMNPPFRFPKFYDKFYFEKGSIAAITDINKAGDILKNNPNNQFSSARAIAKSFADLADGRRLLEFGCSWGYFLNFAREAGFTCTGVEISEKRSAIGRKLFGLEIIPDIGRLIREGRKFDVIYSAQVLEHLSKDIKNIFTGLVSLLDEQGLMVLEVPQLHPKKGRAGMLNMGAVHPLGFTGDFFLHNLPKYGLEVKVSHDYGGGENIEALLVVYARKKPNKAS